MLLRGWQRRRRRLELLLGVCLSRHSREEAAQVDRRALKGQARLLRPAYVQNQGPGDQMFHVVAAVVQEAEAVVCIHAHLRSVDFLTLAAGRLLEQCYQHLQAVVACWYPAFGSALFATIRDCFLSSGRASCLS